MSSSSLKSTSSLSKSESGTGRWASSDEYEYECYGSSTVDEEKARLDGGYIDTSATRRPMWRLLAFMAPHKLLLVLAAASSVLNKILDLAPPILVKWVVDTLEGSPPDWLVTLSGEPGAVHPGKGQWHLPLAIGLLTIAIFFFESLFQFLYELLFKLLAQKTQHEARMGSYAALLQREMRFFERHRTGDLLSLLNNDINQLERFLNTGLNEILQFGVVLAFSGAILFYVSWELTLIGLTPIPVILAGSFLFQALIQPRYKVLRAKVGELAARLENNISGIAVTKAFTAEAFEFDRVDTVSSEYRDANFRAIRVAAAYIPVIRMSIAVGFAAVLTCGTYWVINDEKGLSIGDLVMFSMLIQRLLWPITRLGATIDEFLRARASARRVFTLLDQAPEIRDPENPKLFPAPAKSHLRGKRKAKRKAKAKSSSAAAPLLTSPHAQGAITFEDVWFSYAESGSPAILRGLTCRLAAGETVGIAGLTGAGKSTLAKLVLRMYDVNEGVVCIDGVDVRSLPLDVLRANIALVSQDTYLFHGTIRENIAYGLTKRKYLSSRVEAAAREAELHDFITSLPDGYETLIGERGVRLSGGQRQRLSIARALLKDAPILILDEATSAVDTETELSIQRNLRKLTAGKTALVIAHRLSTIRHADRILVLHEGVVAEEDTHDNLIAAGGTYARLWNIQIGELFDSSSSSSS
ncbi:ATPase [Thecamonas trahens ATCC 50062]|uniref:ATPase n=1 Tax=Thecamonas trahens ATCC 50062 TaxID=461836 RepID=A0A0L0D1J1_THETB|nr:ATPase [Thecamonas trahens ATCC 50062]KNC46107.1 ATPase [Thecamonas trahens ATCC 50062]|eukprot:XP_013763085.1 ATPase [Thecamonas trahens ATCC 50062]